MTLPVFVRFVGRAREYGPTVHILRGGLAGGDPLCTPGRVSPELGGTWPPGHQWIAENNPHCDELANCPECRRCRRNAVIDVPGYEVTNDEP